MLMPLSSMEPMAMLDTLDTPMLQDTLAMLDTPTPMVPTPIAMDTTLARGLLTLRLRLMLTLLFSMVPMAMLDTPMLDSVPMVLTPMLLPMVPTPMPMEPMDTTLARGLLMLSLRLMLLSSMVPTVML